ncbi:MAG: 1,4-alpha-glucan branching enzyme [Lachnospiraceae bacterium]|nr:1,4-alpha-glucan branching enzyme [Lachnospiraceae bacterium]
MNNKLYKLMNWPEIEEIVYSDGNDPHRILGAHKVGSFFLVQAFRPDAQKLSVITGSGAKEKAYEMEVADEAGFFAALIPYQKDNKKYEYEMLTLEGETIRFRDPYIFEPVIGREDAIKLSGGVHYSVYERLGAHPVKHEGVNGVQFAVWAPHVSRVSVIGAFNGFDGRIHQMRMSDSRGIFEIFIPDLKAGAEYQYEIKTVDGHVFVKPDPYTIRFGGVHKRVQTSVVCAEKEVDWEDERWMNKRRRFDKAFARLSICELSLTKFAADHGLENANYETLAPYVAEYLQDAGFNTLELMPVMEHLTEDPYAVTGYFAVSDELGTKEQFREFMELMHASDIRVIMDFPATFFSGENMALRQFTGNALYEYGDSRGVRPNSEYVVFDYGRKEVQNYLLSCALYWLDTFHLDGLRLPDISKILYLDYDRAPGEWTPNIYGSNENLEAEEFVRSLNAMVNKKDPGLLMITKETACYPQVTGAIADGGLGFDYKWNNGWSRDFFQYMRNDPIYRSAHHNELTFSLIYHYSEHFILAFSHEDIGGLKPMLEMMPGDDAAKAANARFALAYLYLHPGRKMVYRGISDFQKDDGKNIGRLIRELNRMYLMNKALYLGDDNPEGFVWINSIAAEACYMAFLRRDGKGEETLLCVCNMAGVEQELTLGVPEDGKYTQILNTDDKRFGGTGRVYGSDQVLEPVHQECDGREYMLTLFVAPLSVAVFRHEPYTEEENKIRAIRHDSHDRMEQERKETRSSMEEKLRMEEEKLLQELRARYEQEISAQEKAIADKYHEQEEIKIRHVLSGEEIVDPEEAEELIPLREEKPKKGAKRPKK